MNIYEAHPQFQDDLPSSLHRVPSTLDLARLSPRRQKSCHKLRRRQSPSLARSSQSENADSENSQAVYMALRPKSERARKHGHSLSAISNGSARRLDGSADDEDECRNEEAAEELSWNIIDREIFEWQYVCQTGRPYWWSPESRYSRLKRQHRRCANEPSPRNWMRSIEQQPKPAYSERRKVMTDSYLADSSTVQDLAHLVAIQLLGACFTLPPDHVTGAPAPNYTTYDKTNASAIPNPRMISSLRLHTHFRYSPCFGHEPRNPSPVPCWPATFDGPSHTTSPTPPESSVDNTGTETVRNHSRRSRISRALHRKTVSSDSDGFQHTRLYTEVDLNRTAATKFRPNGVRDRTYRALKGSHHSESATWNPPRPRTPVPSQDEAYRDNKDAHQGVQSSRTEPKINYRLQPVIRSEPHHVFVQPVKELVVRRWRRLRRRLSGSLHGSLPAHASEDQTSASESDASSASNASPSSSDAITRRRRAQERGDIVSSSVDDVPHYTTPASGGLTPAEEREHWFDSPIPSPTTTFRIRGPLNALAVAGSSTTESNRHRQSLITRPSTAPDLELSSRISTLSVSSGSVLATCGSSHRGSDSFPSYSPVDSSPSSGSSPIAQSPRKTSTATKGRDRRKSLLSEVYTPEDFQIGNFPRAFERSIFSAIGSTLVSPKEEHEPLLVSKTLPHSIETSQSPESPLTSRVPLSIEIPPPDPPHVVRARPLSLETPSSPEPEGGRVGKSEDSDRPALLRTSTSGTQVFKPSADGVELDGLPVGPSKDAWMRKGKRRERTFL